MKREIKFRLWAVASEDMFFADEDIYFVNGKPAFPENTIPMQYVNRKDEAGVEVYENDIVETDDEKIGYISFMEETSEYVIDYWKKGQKESKGESLSAIDIKKVLGNTYENKDLLK